MVEISPNSNPPVVKIIDWGKYNYQKTKLIQKNKKNTKSIILKQIRLGVKIGENDLLIKIKKAEKFLASGHKVKFIIVYKGREQAHKELGFKLSEKIIDQIRKLAIVDQNPTLLGRQLTFVVKSNSKLTKETNNAKIENS